VTTDAIGLRVAIDTGDDTTLVVPVGLLTLAASQMLRTKLLACMADQPAAVIVDLAMMRAEAPYLLSAFGSVARASARWSGVPLLLVSDSSTDQRLWMTTTALTQLVRVYPTHALALGAIDTPVPRTLFARVLAPSPESARIARRSVDSMVAYWGCLPSVDDAVLVADELVSNAIIHGHGPVVLRMELRHRVLTVSVADDSAIPPVLHRADGNGNGGTGRGHGLRLVEALTRRWGTTPTTSGGKIVWAVFDAT
jgi:histidine kinase-like protein